MKIYQYWDTTLKIRMDGMFWNAEEFNQDILKYKSCNYV